MELVKKYSVDVKGCAVMVNEMAFLPTLVDRPLVSMRWAYDSKEEAYAAVATELKKNIADTAAEIALLTKELSHMQALVDSITKEYLS